MDLTAWQIVFVILFGFLSGVINTIAGGGSLIIVPLYLYLGVPPVFANYINRIPILAQSTVATISYATTRAIKWKKIIPYLAPTIGGVIIGALLAVDISARTINRILAAVLCFVIVSLVADLFEKRHAHRRRVRKLFTRAPSYWLTIPILFAIGLYGGFIQIGMGLIIYPVIHIIFQRHYLVANVAKVCIIGISCLLSLAIFWSSLTPPLIYLGLLTAVGSVGGGILGVRMTIGNSGKTIIRAFLIIVSVIGIVRLLFVL